MRSTSSDKTSIQVLARSPSEVMPQRKLERLLLDWVNLAFSDRISSVDETHRRLVEHYPNLFNDTEDSKKNSRLFGFLLQKAWTATEERKRDWYLDDAASFYHVSVNRFGDPPTYATPMEAVLYYFRRNLSRARRCRNPECVAPFFLAGKKGQKYCSDACCVPALRSAKLRWWNANRKGKPRKTKRRKA